MKSEEEIIEMGYCIQNFLDNTSLDTVKPKDLMPELIEKGFFNKDHRNSLPLRNILREIEANDKLFLLPQVSFQQKAKTKYGIIMLLKIRYGII